MEASKLVDQERGYGFSSFLAQAKTLTLQPQRAAWQRGGRVETSRCCLGLRIDEISRLTTRPNGSRGLTTTHGASFFRSPVRHHAAATATAAIGRQTSDADRL